MENGLRARNPSFDDRSVLRRQPSRLDERLTKAQKLDIRAHQRTYQGAYIRTCIGCFSISLLIMKLFSREFLSIGLVFQIYGLLLCLIGYSRGMNIDLYFLDFNNNKWYSEIDHSRDIVCGHIEVDNKYYFKTSGNYVLLLTILSCGCYIVMFILLAIM